MFFLTYKSGECLKENEDTPTFLLNEGRTPIEVRASLVFKYWAVFSLGILTLFYTGDSSLNYSDTSSSATS